VREEVAAPAVVVATHERDRDTAAPEVVQAGHALEVASRDCRPIFEPEVEQVAVDEQGVPQVGDGGEKRMKGRGLGRSALAQVGISDYDDAGGHHGPS
jgi:hypothetical protein